MKRVIYAPKVYIFIRSSNLGVVYDVSSDVVSGSVTQNTNDVSTANFYLRNRYQKWIRDKASGEQIFLPMDMVTIWLQRIAGKPIQVFTGYLDSVPYYQAYSGDAYFEATCTLKKLAFTWFDPGLPTFAQFLQQNGYAYDVTTGEAIAPAYAYTGEPITTPGPGEATGTQATMNDAGFAGLLGQFMLQVCGWSADDVLISALPSHLPKVAAQLYSSIETQTQADLKSLANFMAQAMGVPGWSGGDTQTTASGSTVVATNAIQIVKTIKAVADQYNIPLIVLVYAAFVLTGMNAKFSIPPGLGSNNNWGYGLYALQPTNVLGSDPITAATGIEGSGLGGIYTSKIQGYTIDEIQDPTRATTAFCKLLQQNSTSLLKNGAQNNDLTSITTWITTALGRQLPTSPAPTSALTYAKQLCVSSQTVSPTASPSLIIDPSSITFDDLIGDDLVTAAEAKIIKTYYKDAPAWLAGLVYAAKQVSSNLTISTFSGKPKDGVLIVGSKTNLNTLYQALVGNQYLDQVTFKGSNQPTLAYGVASTTTKEPNGITVSPSLYLRQTTRPPANAVITSGANSGTLASAFANGALGLEQIGAFSANAAFAANFAFPTDVLLSTSLTGNRALMNDQPCMNGVKQFCQSSMRCFRSLPDGRFLAFYPDYFGATRKAYWSIKNIEIVDFGIQLNDNALATHVYVIGDTYDADSPPSDIDEISTRGVATINQALMLSSFIESYSSASTQSSDQAPITPPNLGRLSQAQQFLEHYGARPHTEEQPLIRNTFYEFLMAWQRFMQLWASQFATSVEFTFQPEVMAGGLIAFPDHGIQMYCENVTHNFDYIQGFATNATMTAPSLLANQPTRSTSMPGFALAGNINSVGFASGGD